MLEHVRSTVMAVDTDPKVTTRWQALKALRSLSLDDFGEVLWSMPNPEFPRLSVLLPRMATLEVQESWTGATGHRLLAQTSNFTRSVVFNYAELTGRKFADARVLDFGCGYGRIARMMYRFLDEEQVIGVDPWSESLRVSKEDGLTNFYLSEYLPNELPVGGNFDLVYAFSVFTHTSERATKAAFSAIRKQMSPNSLFVAPIRPVEYWLQHPKGLCDEMQSRHRVAGFTFSPHSRAGAKTDGDVTYGDTSMTTDWMTENLPGWILAGEDRTLSDPTQRYLFFRPG